MHVIDCILVFRYPESKLAKLFSGELPIILDTMKQHYFIDRDGPSFRHILQFLRSDTLTLPQNYNEIEILLQEARYYELEALVQAITEKQKTDLAINNKPQECLTISMCPDLGERIFLSGRKPTIEQCFPELTLAISDSRNSGWTLESNHVIRFPINGFCKLNSIQVLERVMNNRFTSVTSNGGGVEGQQFSNYIFTRESQR